MSAVERLYEALFGLYYRAGREVTYVTAKGETRPYWPNYYLRALKQASEQNRIVPWVEGLILGHPNSRSRGYEYLRDANRLDLTAEAVVVEGFADLVSEEAVETALARLREDGYETQRNIRKREIIVKVTVAADGEVSAVVV